MSSGKDWRNLCSFFVIISFENKSTKVVFLLIIASLMDLTCSSSRGISRAQPISVCKLISKRGFSFAVLIHFLSEICETRFLHSRPRPWLRRISLTRQDWDQDWKSFGLKMQNQYLDLWYTVSIFETKTGMGIKRHNWFQNVRPHDESLACTSLPGL